MQRLIASVSSRFFPSRLSGKHFRLTQLHTVLQLISKIWIICPIESPIVFLMTGFSFCFLDDTVFIKFFRWHGFHLIFLMTCLSSVSDSCILQIMLTHFDTPRPECTHRLANTSSIPASWKRASKTLATFWGQLLQASFALTFVFSSSSCRVPQSLGIYWVIRTASVLRRWHLLAIRYYEVGEEWSSICQD